MRFPVPDEKPVMPDEQPFDTDLAGSAARKYIQLALPGAMVVNLELLWQRRVAAVWKLDFTYKGESGDFYLVGGDVPFILLDRNDELTTVAEALTVYCWYVREWYRTKGEFMNEDFYHPVTWERLDYWNNVHTDWLSLRTTFLEWKVLPKMIYDGELKCPDVIAIARRIGNDIYYQQLIDAGQFDKKPGK